MTSGFTMEEDAAEEEEDADIILFELLLHDGHLIVVLLGRVGSFFVYELIE
jgi:hypothetical protein